MHPEESLPNAKYYTMATLATVDLPARNMTFVKTGYLDEEGHKPHHKTLLDIKGGYIAPGIIRINGVAGPKDSIAIMNCTNDNFTLREGEPFGSAFAVEEDDLLYIENENVNNLNITSPQVINLMTVASITEEAYVEVQELDSEPDDLNEALDYNPAEVLIEDVQYDRARFRRLMSFLNTDSWKLTRKQREQAENILQECQAAFNLPGEKLRQTHLLEHDIQLTDPSKVINVKPRYTPYKQRPHIDKEIDGLIDHGLVVDTDSPYSSPIVLVKKGRSGMDFRMTVDFRQVNRFCLPQHVPVLISTKSCSRLVKARFTLKVISRLAFTKFV